MGSQGSHSPGPERNGIHGLRRRHDDAAYEQAGEREEYAQAMWQCCVRTEPETRPHSHMNEWMMKKWSWNTLVAGVECSFWGETMEFALVYTFTKESKMFSSNLVKSEVKKGNSYNPVRPGALSRKKQSLSYAGGFCQLHFTHFLFSLHAFSSFFCFTVSF